MTPSLSTTSLSTSPSPRAPSRHPSKRPALSVPRAIVTYLLVGVAGLCTGCVGSIDNEEAFGPAPECRIDLDVEDLFRQRCGTGTCHGNETADPAAELDLVSPNPGPRIVGTMSTQCDGRMRIHPDRPDDSFLLEKLEGPREGCGDRMPLVGFLDQAEVACVRDWVREQARLVRMRDAGVPGDTGTSASASDDGSVP